MAAYLSRTAGAAPVTCGRREHAPGAARPSAPRVSACVGLPPAASFNASNRSQPLDAHSVSQSRSSSKHPPLPVARAARFLPGAYPDMSAVAVEGTSESAPTVAGPGAARALWLRRVDPGASGGTVEVMCRGRPENLASWGWH